MNASFDQGLERLLDEIKAYCMDARSSTRITDAVSDTNRRLGTSAAFNLLTGPDGVAVALNGNGGILVTHFFWSATFWIRRVQVRALEGQFQRPDRRCGGRAFVVSRVSGLQCPEHDVTSRRVIPPRG